MSRRHDKLFALTDFVEVASLQEIQDAFVNVTGLATSIRDAEGELLTTPSGSKEFRELMRSTGLAETTCAAGEPTRYVREGGVSLYACAIVVSGQPLGTILVGDRSAEPVEGGSTVGQLGGALDLLRLLAGIISRLCRQEHELRKRVGELSTIYDLTGMLTGREKLQTLLDQIARKVAEVMNVKASGIRLLDEATGELRIQAVWNLSATYLNKGRVSRQKSPIDQAALSGQTVYVADFASDPRVQYPEEAGREGLASGLVTGLVYRGSPIGVMRIYTATARQFSSFEASLLHAVASQAAAAISNARLLEAGMAKVRLDRQMRMAGEVQRRMLPKSLPQRPGLQIACFYEPCMAVGGDYYDFIELSDGRLGIVVADVVGHGLPASLQMASLRSCLRIYSGLARSLSEMMAKVNGIVTEELGSGEFVTLFYGMLEPDLGRIRFVNAGHEPPILLRDGQVQRLVEGGMVLGVDDAQSYGESAVELHSGDRLVLLTDGVIEAVDYDGQLYGRERLRCSLLRYQELPVDRMIKQMAWDVRRFAGLQEQSDDITLLGLHVL